MSTLATKSMLLVLGISLTGEVVAQQAQELQLEGEPVALGGVDLPRSLGTLGDSITAGAVANYSRKYASLQLFEVVPFALFFAATGVYRPIEAPTYSWAQGMNFFRPVNSHAHRLTDLRGGKRMKIHSSSVSAQESKNVASNQLDDLMEWSQKNLGQSAPDYVTVLIGANDICNVNAVEDMVPVSRYADNIAYALDQMLVKSPRTKVLLSAIPNITSLREVAKDSPLFVQTGKLANTCDRFWHNVYKDICPLILIEDDPMKTAQVARRVYDYNLALKDLATSRSAEFGDRVRFGEKVYEMPFDEDDMSLDCFHPGPRGHNKIAEESWKSTWWSGMKR